MTQYDEVVSKQQLLLEAEEWSKGITDIHVHSITNMWYEENPQDMDNGSVTDTRYNDGRIIRTKGDKVIRVMGDVLTGDDLISAYCRQS